jgi:histidine triad (HIT) family protein
MFAPYRRSSATPLPARGQHRYDWPMETTIFHRILSKELPADIVYEDDDVMAFKDIHPKAPTHILFVPKRFAASIVDLTPETADLPGMLILKAKEFAASQGIDGYKLVFHVGKGGGQEVFYLHLHLLSQKELPSNK